MSIAGFVVTHRIGDVAALLAARILLLPTARSRRSSRIPARGCDPASRGAGRRRAIVTDS
ncbi:hypothetical protein ABA31_12690 [Agrococcus baldri]|uniref:Uncharacterized protein n=1 Tax=Agrococcus baldri TaxID=153730 RepID=A0AA87URL9_9MICO|nr:hypothetical protein ABA31_12690 [Agrococcus baldri]